MRFRDITTRRLLVAAATFTLLAGAGCTNLSAYKQQYYVQVEKNKELKDEIAELKRRARKPSS